MAGGPTDWSALWCSYVAKAGPGSPPFESLTLTQLRTWLAEGDPDEKANEYDEGYGHWAFGHSDELRAFWGNIGDDPDPDIAGAGADGPVMAQTSPAAVAFPWMAGPDSTGQAPG